MVRLKHRWTTVALVPGQGHSLKSVTAANIQRALEVIVLTLSGNVGLSKLMALCVIVYWYPSSGVFVCKTTIDGFLNLRPAIVLLSEVADIPVRPQVINTSATLAQTRRFLIDQFHKYLAEQYYKTQQTNRKDSQSKTIAWHEKLVLGIT